ncbi:MAG: serine/threonine protein kinase [Myxococcales bacterium]|nr:serine/threonine protein kinase [Myxococcales bacterium]
MTESSGGEQRGSGEALIGRVLGGAFRVESQIGEGAMGLVYLARQLSIDREVVVKVLKRTGGRDAALDELLAKRFRREAQATARLTHPHTVRVIDYGETQEGLQFIVFERLVGESLDAILKREQRLDPARVARVGAKIARSLDEAHAAGVIHRDLKPENVFLCAYGDQRDVVKGCDRKQSEDG